MKFHTKGAIASMLLSPILFFILNLNNPSLEFGKRFFTYLGMRSILAGIIFMGLYISIKVVHNYYGEAAK